MKYEIPINLNNFVKFKLTDLGKKVWDHQNDELNEFIAGAGAPPLKPRILDVDEEGYMKLQLWEFMNVFGEAMHMGFDTIIEQNTLVYEYDFEKERTVIFDE